MGMDVREKTAAALRVHVRSTELGPVTVRVQPGTGGGSPAATERADVYLHGASGSWTTFERLLSRTPAGTPDRDQVLIDLPGWGDSTAGARPAEFSIDAMGRAIASVLDGLGYRQWTLVGHSMGGFIALHLAAAYPDRAAGVAAISATTFGVSRASRRPLPGLLSFPAFVGMLLIMESMAALGTAGSALVRAVGATPLMRLLTAPFFADPVAVPARMIRGLANDARPASFRAAARAAARYDFSHWQRIDCPVLATRGDSDVFTPPSDLARLAQLIPHARLASIPRCGHFAAIEQPGHVQRLLDDLRAG